jgi:esterase/lipase
MALNFSYSAMADMHKIGFQTAAVALDAYSEPTQASLNQARTLFAEYRRKVDPAAVEYLQHSRVEENVVLYLHSFTQGPYEIKGLHDLFTSNNFNVLALSFSGHELGEDGKPRLNFRDYEPIDWVKDIQFAVRLAKQYGKKIWIMGYSTGGLLAVQQVLNDPSRIKNMILISPALALAQFGASVSCSASFVTNNLDPIGLTDDQERMMMSGGCLIRGTITNVFESTSASALQEASDVLGRIHIPIFLAYTLNDDIVDNWRTVMMRSHTTGGVTQYIYGKEDHASHTDILSDYNVDLEMKDYPGVTMRSALKKFIEQNLP